MSQYRKANVRIADNSNKRFTYSEYQRGNNRDINITCNDDDSTAGYRQLHDNGPLQQDPNWYENNIETFYDSLAKAIANAYIANGSNWANTVNVRIHRRYYEYNS